MLARLYEIRSARTEHNTAAHITGRTGACNKHKSKTCRFVYNMFLFLVKRRIRSRGNAQ